MLSCTNNKPNKTMYQPLYETLVDPLVSIVSFLFTCASFLPNSITSLTVKFAVSVTFEAISVIGKSVGFIVGFIVGLRVGQSVGLRVVGYGVGRGVGFLVL